MSYSPVIRRTLRFVLILAALNFFFLSISLLGAFKGDAKIFAQNLISSLYGNPFVGLLVGILVTSVMQSSSATTSIVVSFVATGLFGTEPTSALYAAIPIIMGANIGTSITNTIVAIGHIGDINEFKRAFSSATVHDFFNFMTVLILLPVQIFTNFIGKFAYAVASVFSSVGGATFKSPLKAIIKPQFTFVSDLFSNYDFLSKMIMLIILSFIFVFFLSLIIKELIQAGKKCKLYICVTSLYLGLVTFAVICYPDYILTSNVTIFALALVFLFSSLTVFVKVMKSITSGKLEILFNRYIFKNSSRAFILGILLTALLQSSSVTTSIVVPLAGAGILNIYQIFPYVLGANIGTTITAILAALSLGNVLALSVAVAHLTFNLIGTCLVYPLRGVPIYLSGRFASLVLINKALPVVIVILFYFILPLLGIFISR